MYKRQVLALVVLAEVFLAGAAFFRTAPFRGAPAPLAVVAALLPLVGVFRADAAFFGLVLGISPLPFSDFRRRGVYAGSQTGARTACLKKFFIFQMLI